MTKDWSVINVDDEPRFLIARRKSSGLLDSGRISVHQEAHDVLRDVAIKALYRLAAGEAREYAPFGELHDNDYFELETDELPRRVDHRRSEDNPERFLDPALLDFVEDTDNHEELNSEQVRDSAHSLYAVSFRQPDGSYCGFVRKSNPKPALKPGKIPLELSNTLRPNTRPQFVLDDQVDIVVASDAVGILSPYAARVLFGDVDLAKQSVPENVSSLRDTLSRSLPLTDQSLAEIQSRCNRRIHDARRLQLIVDERSAELSGISQADLRSVLQDRSLERLIDDAGKLSVEADDVGEFLDCLEGRLFDDDFTGSARRADAYSPR